MHKKNIFLFYFFIFINGCTPIQKDNLPNNALYKTNTLNAESSNAASYKVRGKNYRVMKSGNHYEERGMASWYGQRFNKKRTSSGERYNMFKMTAAHKTLPLDTHVLVTNLKNGKQVVVKVNDRGPFISNRLIDLSYSAAKKLGILGLGLAPVKITVISNESA